MESVGEIQGVLCKFEMLHEIGHVIRIHAPSFVRFDGLVRAQG